MWNSFKCGRVSLTTLEQCAVPGPGMTLLLAQLEESLFALCVCVWGVKVKSQWRCGMPGVHRVCQGLCPCRLPTEGLEDTPSSVWCVCPGAILLFLRTHIKASRFIFHFKEWYSNLFFFMLITFICGHYVKTTHCAGSKRPFYLTFSMYGSVM